VSRSFFFFFVFFFFCVFFFVFFFLKQINLYSPARHHSDVEIPDGATGAALTEGYDRDRFVFTRTERFSELPSYFDIPLASLWVACHRAGCADAAAAADRGGALSSASTGRNMYAAFIRGFIFNYTCADCDGTVPTSGYFFPAIVADLPRFLVPWSEDEMAWLASISARGDEPGARPLCAPFVVSNALAGFVEMALDFCCGGSRVWRDWFAFVIGEAAKPHFFTAGSGDDDRERPFALFAPGQSSDGDTVTETPMWEKVTLRRGCAAPLIRALVRDQATAAADKAVASGSDTTVGGDQPSAVPAPQPRVIYVGDHLRNDVFAARHTLGWATIAVVEEVAMEHMMDTVVAEIGEPQWDYGAAWGSAFLAEEAAGAGTGLDSSNEIAPRSFRGGAREVQHPALAMSTALMVRWADLVIPSLHDLVVQFNKTLLVEDDD
jgi:hypothetical protein